MNRPADKMEEVHVDPDEQTLRANRLRKEAISTGKRDTWIKWTVILGVLAVLLATAWKPVKGFLFDRNISIGRIVDAQPSSGTGLPSIDLETASPDEIALYAERKREYEQAQQIKQRARDELAKQSGPAQLSDLTKLQWEFNNWKEAQDKENQRLNRLIGEKKFNAAIDTQAVAAQVTPYIIQQVLDTPEGREWLEETIAWYVKRDIKRFHPHKARE